MDALVTGAASGIGLATATALRNAGWRVAGLDLRAGPGVEHAADVRDETALRAAVAGAIGDGGLDALVCCAGVSGSAAGDGAIEDTTGAAFDTVVGTNLRGALIAASAAWPALTAARGSVVLISSVLGLTGGGGPFRSTSYIVSKGGLVALTRALAAQGRGLGVRANCVAPGLVDTPFAARARTDPAVAGYVADRQPLTGGPITPATVAAAVAYLCSPAAAPITGQVLSVDAGWQLDPA